eukprot:c20020_g1_i1 orf=128-1159(-)
MRTIRDQNPPISAEGALSLMQSGFFSMQEAGNPPLRNLGSSRDERKPRIKRAREDLVLRDAFECKRPAWLIPDYAAANAESESPALDCGDKSCLLAQSKIISRGNRDNIDMPSHVCRASNDIKDRNSDLPGCFPTARAEKKIRFSEDKDHAISPGQAQWGNKQSSPSSARPDSRVLVDVTNKFQITATPVGVKKQCMEEDDVHRLSQRHKQIEFGKNTLGYERYIELIPKSKRKHKDPRTPNPKQVCSKRSWDGQIRQWRRLLHDYDPPAEDGEELAEDFTQQITNLKHEKLAPEKDNIDLNTLNSGLPCRPLHGQESREGGFIGGVANEDVGLSIYEDWMES